MTKDEALKLALEALKWANKEINKWLDDRGLEPEDHPEIMQAITAIKEALAHPEITTGNILMDSYNAMQSMKVEGPRHVVCQCDKCKAQPEQLREENERLHVENRRLIDRIETIGVPVGVGGWLTTTTSAQLEQKPVGQLLEDAFGRGQVMWFNKPKDESMLYTTPPQRTWVGLTDEEIDHFCHLAYTGDEKLVLTIQEKLKEKNT